MIPILIPLWLALRPLLSVVLASILLVALGLAVSGAEDAIITVNSASDSTNSGDGDCTLREAIINANSDSDLTKGDCTAGSADDTIQFNLSSGSEIKLAGTALPTITHRLTLDGSPSQNLTISAENKSRLFVIGYSTDVTITHVAIANGQENWGAGILNDGQLVLLNTSFENNSAGIEPAGAIYNRNGSLVVRGSTFFSNSSWQGGAIMSSSGPVNIYSSTFEDNSALYGGAVYNSKGIMAVYNSTFSANTADRFGGAVNHGSSNDLVINSCTFYLNAANHPDYPGGGGIYVSAGKTLHLSNSILANSLNGGDCTNDGNLGTHKGNLIKDGSCSPAIPADPKLGPLQDNGGPTETHALLGGSPAIDAGEGAYCPALDQRGIARDGKCDIGAYEYQGLSDFLFIPLARKD